MKIVDISEQNNGKTRLKTLIDMPIDKQAIVGLSEFKTYGSDAVKSFGLDIALNRVFILGNLPLLARGRTDKVVIKKLEKFDLELYNKADRREMGANHVETVKAKLAEVLA